MAIMEYGQLAGSVWVCGSDGVWQMCGAVRYGTFLGVWVDVWHL